MNLSMLKNTALFRGAEESELQEFLSHSAVHTYEKGDFIYHCGQTMEEIGLVLSGSVIMESDDLWGNRSIIGKAESGQIFGETYACLPGTPLLIQVTAAEKSEILFCRIQKIPASESGNFRQILLRNLLRITAQKNLQLSRRILCTSPKTIRGRLMTYLSDQAKQTGSYTVTIPYNRQQLADYLGVDRSALSHEISGMQKDGLFRCERNRFHLQEQTIF